MPRTALNGQQAARYVRVAQVAGLALAATAVLLWVGGVPGMAIQDRPAEALVIQPPAPEPAKQPGSAAPKLTRDDLDDMAQRLEMARVKVEKPEPAPTVVAEQPADTEQPTIGGNPDQPRWRYLGSIIEPNRSVALVSISGRQRILGVGREVDGVEVVSVEPDAIVVRENGELARLTRDERSGPPVAWVKMNSPMDRPAIPAGANVGASLQLEPDGENAGRPFFRRQNGLDPQRAEQLRAMAAERAERRRMLRDRDDMRRQREVNGE